MISSWDCENCKVSGEVKTEKYKKHKRKTNCCPNASRYIARLVKRMHGRMSPNCDSEFIVIIT
ncbi:MAG: hypothetical protein R3346_04040, partial [Candidatus Spechtbacterales bacterium]|nr:hypothetical protein [Candidatus Spechtbacterales bacterium]